MAPRLIYECFEQVRAYETVMETASITMLHALRIDFKRLRYTLEFFEEVLGREVKIVIKEVKIMQDHLGDLNDAEVAIAALRAFVDHYHAQLDGVPIFMRADISGVMQYAAAKEAERRRLLDTFPPVWENFLRDDVRRNLALAISIL